MTVSDQEYPELNEREGLFKEQVSRKPDKYPWTKDAMKAMWHNPWSADKFTFHSDVNDFKVLMNDQEREMITRCLSAIAQIEVAVKTFWSKLGENMPHPSISDLGAVMAGIEVIHNVAYERLLEELDLNEVFQKNLELEIIEKRVKYLRKHTHRFYKDSKKQYIYALILFTLYVENTSLFSQFYTICHFNRFKNMLKDTTQQVTYTSKEEAIHALCGMRLINDAREEYPELFDEEFIEKIRYETQESYKAEADIIDWQLNGIEDEFISPAIVKNMIKQRLNDSLEMINIKPVFDDVDPELLTKSEWFDEDILGEMKTDFFHARPTEYSKNNRAYDEDELYGD
jgi:ribonucleoside-diphosphate reductase beta chain